jgi:glyoxylase-like metal-dependent hydrolase (beta-lactamase superfamily II)
MRRVTVLCALLAVGALSIVAGASRQAAVAGRQQPQQRVVEVEKLKDNLFVLRGGGGNTAVFVVADGVIVVDTKNPGWGQPILDKIRELTPKPVTTIINTHTHGDHVSGNVEFPTTVQVVTQANTKANMEKMAAVTGLNAPAQPQPSIFQQNNGRGLPTRTFTDRMTLGSGADRVDLYYFGRGHTNGDAFVVFPAQRTMHAGDIFSGKNIPLIDANNGGSGVALPDTLAKAHSTIQNIDAIITGHSTVMTWNDLEEYADFNREFLNAMREAKKAGRSAQEAAAAWTVPARFTGYAPPQAQRLQVNAEVIYRELP